MAAADREREPWRLSGPVPFLTVGSASVQTLGGDRYLVAWRGSAQVIEGFDRARQLAHELADDRS